MTPAALQSCLALLEALPAGIAADVTSLTVSSADLVTFTLGSRTVVWGSGEESVRKVAILQALLRTKAKVIDVSAPDTPVTRWPRRTGPVRVAPRVAEEACDVGQV